MSDRTPTFQVDDRVRVRPISDIDPIHYGAIGVVKEVIHNSCGDITLLRVYEVGPNKLETLATPACYEFVTRPEPMNVTGFQREDVFCGRCELH